MIQVQQLRKSFDHRIVVRDLSFEAPDGAITGILDANGAGKTTTLRVICGVLQPESGSVRIDDVSGSENPLARQRRLGALLDHTGIYSRLTVRENLTYFGRLRGMPPEFLPGCVDRVLSLLGLESIADRRTSGFSRGERMKTALGRAILHSPQNLLPDEPANGLDVPTVRSLRDLLRRLRDSGTCVLFSSHEYRTACGHDLGIFGGRMGVCDCDQPRQLVSFGVGHCRFCGALIAPLPEQVRNHLVRRRLIFV
jgi:sodium transport system ATP-binding protein